MKRLAATLRRRFGPPLSETVPPTGSARYRTIPRAVLTTLDDITGRILGCLEASAEDSIWTPYTVDELRQDVRSLRSRLLKGDRNALWALEVLFLPTGALQETAMTNGWTDTYMALAARVDELVDGVRIDAR